MTINYVALKDLKPNPFKRQINNGKLDQEQVKRLCANIKELGLMGALPVFKRDGEYYLVAGHHRVAALKRVYGSEHKIAVSVHEYDDDTVLRGMVIENLTQRSGEFREEAANLLAVKRWLQKTAVLPENSHLSDGRRAPPQNLPEPGSVRDIAEWLNKNGEVMAISKIYNLLTIKENLSPALIDKVGDKGMDLQTAVSLSRTDNTKELLSHEEQEAIADIISDEDEYKNRDERVAAISNFKKLGPDERAAVLSGERPIKTDSVSVLSDAEMRLKLSNKANDLLIEMRNLRKTLTQFRSEGLFKDWTPKQRSAYCVRLGKVREEYGILVDEISKSLEVLNDE